MRHLISASFGLSLLLLAGCGAGGTAAATPTLALSPLGPAPTLIPSSPVTPAPTGAAPTLPAGVAGRLVFAPGDGSIWIQDSLVARPHALIPASPTSFSEAPGFSPDGRLVTFRQMTLRPNAPAVVSIQIVGIDGKEQRALVTPPDVQNDVLWPAFSPDGQWVYYTQDSADHRHSEIRRVKTNGGESARVLDDGRQAVVSPDGKLIAFIRFNIDKFTTSLWVADSDGRNARPLLREDTFLSISAPHFSPDGRSILFAASGPPKHSLQAQRLAPTVCEPWLLCIFAARAYADGLPWDLWTISPDGKEYRQLTNVGGDSPWPAWSGDGRYIIFFQTNGIYLLEVTSGNVTQLSRNGGHGILDWWS